MGWREDLTELQSKVRKLEIYGPTNGDVTRLEKTLLKLSDRVDKLQRENEYLNKVVHALALLRVEHQSDYQKVLDKAVERARENLVLEQANFIRECREKEER